MDRLGHIISSFSNLAWGLPLVLLLIGGGLYLITVSTGTIYRYLGLAIKILTTKSDRIMTSREEISPLAALSTALASTIGMGNIAGVAVAISIGGPGAIFWMWISGLIGMTTKFFTCSLSVMYKGRDHEGKLQGGPMYFIEEALGPRWKPMAVFFAVCCMVGALPVFNANQMTQAIQDIVITPQGWMSPVVSGYVIGGVLVVLTAIVSLGGIKSISAVSERMVPSMVILYFLAVAFILVRHSDKILPSLSLIFTEAFAPQYYKGEPFLGGALGGLILLGIRRGAFSNEAGIGTAPMAHGASNQKMAVKEGLTAMIGPFVDTIIVCTLTSLAIIVTGVWQVGDESGVSLTLKAFDNTMPGWGGYLLLTCIFFFSISSLFSYSYYGIKCVNYLTGGKGAHVYRYVYLLSILFGAISSLDMMINLIDGFYALMAIPTMTATLLLSKKVWKKVKVELNQLRHGPSNV